MIAVQDFYVFRWGAPNGHLEVLHYLELRAPNKLQEMIAADDFFAFKLAAFTGHLDTLRYLETRAPHRRDDCGR